MVKPVTTMTHDTNIPQGYKATALGIIPQEWEVRPLNYLGAICSGGTPDTEVAEYWNGDIAWCTPSDITKLDTKYIESTEVKITAKGLKESSATLLPPRSIVVCTRATIGNAAICNTEIATNQGFKNIIPNEKTNPEWLYYIIIYSKPRLVRFGCGSTFLEVSKKDFSRFKIAVPPLAEQRKIAEVLSVWDEAIEKQARLIEKLALRKRGLMQRLLSAKLRLPGFSDPWKELKINKITIIRKGEQVNKDVLFSNAKYPVINGGITPSGYLDIYNTKANTITISEGGNSCGYVNFMTTPFWSGGHCYTIEAKDGINNLCIYQLLKNNEKYIMSLRVGSGLPNIQIKDLGNLKFMIPTYQEQTAIAEVLTASDREIELAKEKLERLRRQKRGLMQQLLTGKKRVKYGN
jgi:type I restriction enzyme S subunit